MGKIIAVTSGKGGVGKSTLTAHIGTALSRLGYRVLAVDFDAGLRNLDLILGVSEDVVYDLSDVLGAKCEPFKAAYPVKHTGSYWLLPAPVSAEYSIPVGMTEKLLRGLDRFYDFILLDSPAGVGNGFQAAVKAAETAVVVVTPDPVSMRDGEKVGQILRRGDVSEIFLIVNRLKPKMLKQADVNDIDMIIDSVKIRLLGVVPEDEQIPLHAAKGLPLPQKCAAGRAVENIAGRISGKKINLMKIE